MIRKAQADHDIIMNSKSEIVGTRLTRKMIHIGNSEVNILDGNLDLYTSAEKKLILELEEGAGEYLDLDLWTEVTKPLGDRCTSWETWQWRCSDSRCPSTFSQETETSD